MPENIKDLITLYLIYLTIKQHCSHIAVQEVSPHLEISLKSHLSHLSAKRANNLIGFFFQESTSYSKLNNKTGSCFKNNHLVQSDDSEN